ncbi:UNVERIFIED_CONTAM: hypothetical protein K2H54_056997 [Gekko kuhli]
MATAEDWENIETGNLMWEQFQKILREEIQNAVTIACKNLLEKPSALMDLGNEEEILKEQQKEVLQNMSLILKEEEERNTDKSCSKKINKLYAQKNIKND